MSIDTSPTTAVWQPPAQTAVRGTVVVLPGRGENAAVYERFGRRIAADGYLVHAWVGMSPEEQANALGWLALDTVRPLVVVGADYGALEALVVAAQVSGAVDALVLAGTPAQVGVVQDGPAGWHDELDARTACPVHRGRLETELVRGTLAEQGVAEELNRAAQGATPAVPVLVLHGADDAVAPVTGARALASRLPSARLVTVLDGRHDVLNDVSHRSVAAEIVQFLERVRSADYDAPILRVEVA